jgi:predicted urease superfamily metal-dependent hydrolase
MLFAGLTDNEIVKHPASFIHFAGGRWSGFVMTITAARTLVRGGVGVNSRFVVATQFRRSPGGSVLVFNCEGV